MQTLVVEDDPRVTAALKRELALGGHSVVVCKDGAQVVERSRDAAFDVAIFDTPTLDLAALSCLRDSTKCLPVLCLMTSAAVADRVAALNAGADDVLVKPYDPDELLARLAALNRRVMSAGGVRKLGSARLDARRHSLIGTDGETRLTSREYALLAHLADRLGEPVSRTSILEHVWGTQFVGEGNVVDVYIGYLRSKLRQAAAEQVRIEAVRRVGYRLIATV